MKKLCMVCAIALLASLHAGAQDKDRMKSKDVPEATKSAFDAEFPQASGVEWMQKDGNYKAKFTVNTTTHFAEMSPDGKLMSRGIKIERSSLPQAVADAWQNGYANEKVADIYQIEKDSQIHYAIKTRDDKKMVFDMNGTLVKEK